VAGVYIHDTMLVEGIDKRRVTHSERAPRIQHGLFCGAEGGRAPRRKVTLKGEPAPVSGRSPSLGGQGEREDRCWTW